MLHLFRPSLGEELDAVREVFAHQLGQNYRDCYGRFIACGILFNHEVKCSS